MCSIEGRNYALIFVSLSVYYDEYSTFHMEALNSTIMKSPLDETDG
jgi:hypothetical protein